ncbi:hypothetical protein GYMLUDRAFT_45622 [Collybiopsis luxurians FD-317 M1]|uniref:Uncharacterized protein n=1 Tax=Collybiopsis luxurians FD-317 M1 TaxID=944289 RepID=A0A0D0B492_9AGAR|nr:hypothetical protein GYMLUDRAFT_45622 [Collybiopsis luxurians FD-317 M1]
MYDEYNLLTRKRYLQRPWKLFKPYLPRSDSLPDLALVPHQRPLFTCETCNFSNTLVDLCLWCPPGMRSSVSCEHIPGTDWRRRRVSAPPLLLSWKPARQRARSQTLPLTQPPVSMRRFSRKRPRSESDHRTSEFNGATTVSYRQRSLPPVYEGDNINTSEPRACELGADDESDVVTATLPSSLSTSTLPCRLDEGTDHPSRLGSGSVVQAERERHFIYTTIRCVDRGTQDMKGNTDSAHELNTSTSTFPQRQDVSLSSCDDSREASTSSVNHTTPMMPYTPPLRRKKSHFVLHLSAPPSANTSTIATTTPPSPSPEIRQRPQSQPALPATASTSQPLRMPITDMYRRRRIQPDPDSAQPQLGHPSRPYYTALRKNMSPNQRLPPSSSTVMDPSVAVGSACSSNSSFCSRASSPTPTLASAFNSPYVYPAPSPAPFSDDSHELTSVEGSSPAASAFSPFAPSGFGLGFSWPSPTSVMNTSPPPPSPRIPSEGKSGILKLSSLKSRLSLRRSSYSSDSSSTSTMTGTPAPMVFTKSDEMKMRLALAREVRGCGAATDDFETEVDAEGYVYHGRTMPTLKMHVRRLSRGLKERFSLRRG